MKLTAKRFAIWMLSNTICGIGIVIFDICYPDTTWIGGVALLMIGSYVWLLAVGIDNYVRNKRTKAHKQDSPEVK